MGILMKSGMDRRGLRPSATMLIAIASFFSTSVFADDPRDSDGVLPDVVTIRNFAYAGSGCPAGSASGDFPVNGSELLILWNGFSAAAGPGIPLRDARKNCQINLDLDYTAGWQYAVESIEYLGQVDVSDGSQALAGSAYYFQGDAETIRFSTLFDGPVKRRFRIKDTTDAADQVWSTCDATRSLNINFQVRLNNAASADPQGSISFGVGDTAGTFLRLKWRPCAA